jgi:hypothetical protein
MSVQVNFRNGPDAPFDLVLDETFETVEEARAALPLLVRAYGTVPEAEAWLDGEPPVSRGSVLGPHDTAPESKPEPEPEPEQVSEPAAADEADKPKPKPRRRTKKQ